MGTKDTKEDIKLIYVNSSPLDAEDLRVLQELDAEDLIEEGVNGVPDAVGNEKTEPIPFTMYWTQLIRVTMVVMLFLLTVLFIGLAVGAIVELRASV